MTEQPPPAPRKPGPNASMEEILIWEQYINKARWPKPLLNCKPELDERDWQVASIDSMLLQPLSQPKPLYQK